MKAVVDKTVNWIDDNYDIVDRWMYRLACGIVIFAFSYSLFEIWRFY